MAQLARGMEATGSFLEFWQGLTLNTTLDKSFSVHVPILGEKGGTSFTRLRVALVFVTEFKREEEDTLLLIQSHSRCPC